MNELYKLFQTNEFIPIDDDRKEQLFKLDRTKWRLLHYQFETHGMIDKNQILYNESHWKQAFHSINEYCQERVKLKQSLIKEIMNWVHTTECLRYTLYKNFQSTVQHKEKNCCSNCGFLIEEWKGIKKWNAMTPKKDLWQEQLANL